MLILTFYLRRLNYFKHAFKMLMKLDTVDAR
jgi:hypothetical protein